MRAVSVTGAARPTPANHLNSLRVTVPFYMVKVLKLRAGDVLEWDLTHSDKGFGISVSVKRSQELDSNLRSFVLDR